MLLEKINKYRNKIFVGELYYHYRSPSDYYKILNIGLDEATEKVVVVYQAEYGKNLIWIRDIDKWCEIIDNNGIMMQRFTHKDN